MFNLSRFPSLKLLLPVMLGIVLSVSIYNQLAQTTTVWICLALLAVLALISYLIIKKGNSYLITLLLVVVSACYGYISCGFLAQTNTVHLLPSHNYYYSGVIKELSASNTSLKINLKDVTLLLSNDKQERLTQQLVVYIKDYATNNLQPNDTLCFYTAINSTQIITNPFTSNLSNYYRYHNFGFSAYATPQSIVYIGKNTSLSVIKFAYQINQKLFRLLKLHLTNDELAITTAMLLGNDNFIANETLNDYKATGLMHILSVSGMHVALIYGGLLWILGLFKINTRRSIWVNVGSLLFIWLYILIIGSPIAAVRSAFMISFLIFARITRNEANTLNALVASATLLLLYNPLSLMDIGFQLSYMAILGIVVLNPLLKKLYSPKNKLVYYLWELTTVSIAAQLFTTPLLLYYSHTFSNYFLISNVLCIGLSEIIMYCAIVVVFLSPVPYLGFASAYILSLAIQLMNLLTNWIAQLPNTISYIYTIDKYSVGLCYGVIVLVIALIITRKKHYFIYAQLTLCALLFYTAFIYYNKINTSKTVIYAHKNTVGIYAQNKSSACLYYTNTLDEKTITQVLNYNKQQCITHFKTQQIVSLPNYKLKKIVVNNKFQLCNTKHTFAHNKTMTLWFNNKYYNPLLHSKHLVANGFVVF
ncbi:MAG: ComEC/Rec2 family competence protein [Bacteroidia bacterium]|nr:ComEC/Rec2 family competence protein [Bacteroidia bacterium]